MEKIAEVIDALADKYGMSDEDVETLVAAIDELAGGEVAAAEEAEEMTEE